LAPVVLPQPYLLAFHIVGADESCQVRFRYPVLDMPGLDQQRFDHGRSIGARFLPARAAPMIADQLQLHGVMVAGADAADLLECQGHNQFRWLSLVGPQMYHGVETPLP
jgi:hypothetical protein